MITESISRYLRNAGVPFRPCAHPLAVGATRLAETLQTPGRRVAKCVAVVADGQGAIAMLPAIAGLELDAVARVLDARRVRLATEAELAALFPGCELGAAPPFGKLFGLPLIVDALLSHAGPLVVRGGTHEDALQLEYADFAQLESPRVAAITAASQRLPGGELQGVSADAF